MCQKNFKRIENVISKEDLQELADEKRVENDSQELQQKLYFAELHRRQTVLGVVEEKSKAIAVSHIWIIFFFFKR